jgi:hypothetical protein
MERPDGKGHRIDQLPRAVYHRDKVKKGGGYLAPEFVEWLMGYPTGYTELRR